MDVRELVEDVRDRLARMEGKQDVYAELMAKHASSTNARLKPIEKHVTQVRFAAKWSGIMASGVLALLTLWYTVFPRK